MYCTNKLHVNLLQCSYYCYGLQWKESIVIVECEHYARFWNVVLIGQNRTLSKSLVFVYISVLGVLPSDHQGGCCMLSASRDSSSSSGGSLSYGCLWLSLCGNGSLGCFTHGLRRPQFDRIIDVDQSPGVSIYHEWFWSQRWFLFLPDRDSSNAGDHSNPHLVRLKQASCAIGLNLGEGYSSLLFTTIILRSNISSLIFSS